MLNFRNTNMVFVAVLLGIVVWQVMYGVHWLPYVGIALLYFGLIFYGCYYVGSNFFIRVICKATTTNKEIAISFDDGPAANYTAEILALLQEHKVKAAFFCIGKRVAENSLLLQQVHQQGHVIGNHSHSHHFFFDLFTTKKMMADVAQASAEIEASIGLKPILFRPPYGVTNPNLAKVIRAGQYIPIGWNVRSMDTVIKDKQQLLNKVARGLKPGAIFLFHDTSYSTLCMLPHFLALVKSEGYTIVRLDKLLQLQAYA